jgi:hypothetical protein
MTPTSAESQKSPKWLQPLVTSTSPKKASRQTRAMPGLDGDGQVMSFAGSHLVGGSGAVVAIGQNFRWLGRRQRRDHATGDCFYRLALREPGRVAGKQSTIKTRFSSPGVDARYVSKSHL